MGLRPTQGDENAFCPQPPSMETSPFPLSSRAQPRDLQFPSLTNKSKVTAIFPFVIPTVVERLSVLSSRDGGKGGSRAASENGERFPLSHHGAGKGLWKRRQRSCLGKRAAFSAFP